MVLIISEAELRELWQNGKSDLPVFPQTTRFTPSAQDFLRDHQLFPKLAEDGRDTFFLPVDKKIPASDYTPKKQENVPTIYTEADVLEISRKGVSEIIIGDGVIVTDLAREKAFRLGIRITQAQGEKSTISSQPSHNIYRYAGLTRNIAGKDTALGKTIFTDEDIERMHKDGQKKITVTEQTILTDLAKEKAALYGMEIITEEFNNPISNQENLLKLFPIIKQKVLARIGGSIDENTVDAVIQKVLENIR